MTIEEFEGDLVAPTPDDVSLTGDGRRLDGKTAVLGDDIITADPGDLSRLAVAAGRHVELLRP